MQARNRLKLFHKLKSKPETQPDPQNPARLTTLGHSPNSTGAIQCSLKAGQLRCATRPFAQWNSRALATF